MRMVRRALLRALAIVPWVGVAAQAQDPRATLAAAAARDWLALVDRGDAAGILAAASEQFRSKVDEKSWNMGYQKQRAWRGALLSRTLASSRFENRIPGSPPGDYAVLVYRSSFANRSDSAETVSLERDRDGAWRVIGYTIL